MEIIFSLNSLFVLMLLVFGGVTVYGYSKMRMLARFPEGEYVPYEYFMGTDFGTTLAASLTLLPIIFILANSGPLGPAETKRKVAAESASYAYLGQRLGKEMAASYLPPPPPPAAEDDDDAPPPPPVDPEATVPDTVNVLIFYTAPSDVHLYYHKLMLDGFVAGMKEGGVTTVNVTEHLVERKVAEGTAPENTRVTPDFPWPKMDSAVREAGQVDMVVSFMGIPFDFYSSSIAQQVGQKKLKFGAITDNSFTLSSAFEQGRISVAIAPQINSFRSDDFDQTEPEADFFRRYVVITPYTFEKVRKDSPKLFQRRKEL